MNIFEDILKYLLNEQKRALDVIILSVVSSVLTVLFIWILGGAIKRLLKFVQRRIEKTYTEIKDFYLLVTKGRMNLNRFIEMEERLSNGGYIKWYEKKAYNRWKEAEKNHREMIRKNMNEIGHSINTFTDMMKKDKF